MFGNPTPIVLNLLIINIVVFISGKLLGIGANEFLSLHYIGSTEFSPVQFFTYMFVHADLRHLVGNMMGLFLFGPLLEMHLGTKKFLIYYTACGVGAGMLYAGYVEYEMSILKESVSQYMAHPDANSFSDFLHQHVRTMYAQSYRFLTAFAAEPGNEQYVQESVSFVKDFYLAKTKQAMLGASGAVYAVLFGVGYLFTKRTVYLPIVHIPVKMIFVIIFLFGINEIMAVLKNEANDQVAHAAHFSGMLMALVLLKIWQERRVDY